MPRPINGYALSASEKATLQGQVLTPSVDWAQHEGNVGPTLSSREIDPAALSTPQLQRSREYARDLEVHSLGEVVSGCVASLRKYGFCMVDHVVPRAEVAAVRHELSTEGYAQAIAGLSEEDRLREGPRGPVGMHEIVLQPLYQRYLAHPAVVGIAKHMLDAHCRIAQAGRRNVLSDTQAPAGEVGGFGPAANRTPDGREWHTDWPHDLSAYGAADPGRNAGCIRQPFPDVCMCLSMVWYMVETWGSSGTWVVPGSHRDPRNPRGPKDHICVSAPIPGEMQVEGPAGSVFIQDSRMWHSTPCHNTSGVVRVAAQNRWVPWWLNVQYGGGASGGGAGTGWLSRAELDLLPAALRPLLRHLCMGATPDTLQPAVLARAQAASERNAWGFAQVGGDNHRQSNAHVVVRVAKL